MTMILSLILSLLSSLLPPPPDSFLFAPLAGDVHPTPRGHLNWLIFHHKHIEIVHLVWRHIAPFKKLTNNSWENAI